MFRRATRNWLRGHQRQLIAGILAGVLWGVLAAGGATPRSWLILDVQNQLVQVISPDLPRPVSVPLDVFYQTYFINLVEVTLTFLGLCIVAGWVGWHLSIVRPRGSAQERLGQDWDSYVLTFLLAALASALLFKASGLDFLFKGHQPTPAVIVTGILDFLLPLFDGLGLILLWFLRLNSIRAPDWETHYPPANEWIFPFSKSLLRIIRPEEKGGDKTTDT